MDKQALIPFLAPALTAGRLAFGALSAKALYDQAPSFVRDLSSGSWGDAGRSGLGLAASALGAYSGFGGKAGKLLSRGIPKGLSAVGAPTFARAWGRAAAVPRAGRALAGAAGRTLLSPWSRYAAGQRAIAAGLRAQAATAAGGGRLGAALSASVRSVAPSIKGLRPAGVVGTGVYAGAYAFPEVYTRSAVRPPAAYAQPLQPQPAPALVAHAPTPVGPMRLFGNLGGMGAPAHSAIRPWA